METLQYPDYAKLLSTAFNLHTLETLNNSAHHTTPSILPQYYFQKIHQLPS